jgi:hypothetical protein
LLFAVLHRRHAEAQPEGGGQVAGAFEADGIGELLDLQVEKKRETGVRPEWR